MSLVSKMDIDKLKYNTLVNSCFVLAIILFIMQIPLLIKLFLSSTNDGNTIETILDWLRLNLPVFIKTPIKLLLSIILLPFLFIVPILMIAAYFIFSTMPIILIVINLITLYLTVSASAGYKILTRKNQIIFYISILLEIINILAYLYIKTRIS
jgi:hypothetical protein